MLRSVCGFRRFPLALASTRRSASAAYEELGLHNLRNPWKKNKRRRGRGIGSGRGKTSGRGHKGTYARSGGSIRLGFEGGQTPMYRRLPKIGFNNKKYEWKPVKLQVGKLQDFVTMGRLKVPEDRMLTMEELCNAGVVTRSKVLKQRGVHLLGRGAERVTTKMHVEVSKVTQGAAEAIEAAGGTVTAVHFNKLALRALIKPHKFEVLPRRAFPSLKVVARFLDFSRRGYLSPEIQFRNKQLFGAVTSEERLRNEHEKTREADRLIRTALEQLAERNEKAFYEAQRAGEASGGGAAN
eukprot:scaffold1557_cov246-Pinguiococcus_pyrenoidosus.AAC.25